MITQSQILELRTQACDVVERTFVDKYRAPFWCPNIKKIEYSGSHANQARINHEKKICKNNCLPISLAATGLYRKLNNDWATRIVIGYVKPIGTFTKASDSIIERRKMLKLITNDQIRASGFHAWVQVSDDGFRTHNILDLTYGFNKTPSVDNYDALVALSQAKHHVPILIMESDVILFYRRFLSTLASAESFNKNQFEGYMETARKYLP